MYNDFKNITVSLDLSEFNDFEIVKEIFNYNVDTILDYSVFYDFELVTTYEEENSLLIDGYIDFSEFYDFEITYDNI